MGGDTKNAINTLFNTILERIEKAIETSTERGSGFTHAALLYYYFQKTDIRRGESCIMSPDWLISKKGSTQIFHHTKENGGNLNKTILQFLLVSYLYHITVKK